MAEDIFHLGVKALIRNPKGEMLVLKVNPENLKKTKAVYWDIPGGRISKGETIEQTLKREIKEETGITGISSFDFFTMIVSPLRIPIGNSDVGLVLAIYWCDIARQSTVRLSPEHTEYKWVLSAEAAKLLEFKFTKEFSNKLKNVKR